MDQPTPTPLFFPFRAYATAVLVLICGLVLKFGRYPGSALLLLIAAVLLTLPMAKMLFSKQRNTSAIWARAALSCTAWFLVFRLQYWPGQQLIAALTFVLTIYGLLRSLGTPKAPVRVRVLQGVAALLFLGLLFTPSHTLFRSISISSVLSNEAPTAAAWHKYAWFLNGADEYDRALVALDSAIARFPAADPQPLDDMVLEQLEEDRRALVAREWRDFTPFPVYH